MSSVHAQFSPYQVNKDARTEMQDLATQGGEEFVHLGKDSGRILLGSEAVGPVCCRGHEQTHMAESR